MHEPSQPAIELVFNVHVSPKFHLQIGLNKCLFKLDVVPHACYPNRRDSLGRLAQGNCQ